MQQFLRNRLLVGLVALVILLGAFLLVITMSDQQPPPQSGIAQVETGRTITAEDWGNHLGAAGSTVAVVIIVNTIFIREIVRHRHTRRAGR